VARLAGVTDYRLRQLTQAGIYLTAGAPETGARLAALFATLAATRRRPASHRDRGRTIAVIHAAAGAVWFDFEALCAGPRSQNDYIEIAREYQSVIVSDVPVLEGAR